MSLDILLKGQLAFLNQHYNVIAVSGQDEHLENVANREGVKTCSVEMHRTISPVKDLVSLVKLYFLFKKEKPQIVHSITPKAGLLSMIAAYFARVPVRIHTFTGLVFPYKKGFMHHLLLVMDKILCRFATHVFPEGEGVRKDLKYYRITRKPLNIIANGNVNGVDTDFFNSNSVSENQKKDLKTQLNILETDFVFIFVGRLVADKGINELIEAFKIVTIKNNNCKLLLVGPFENELDPLNEDTLLEIKNNTSILSVGFQTDVKLYFSIANALVFPSYREGFPNVVLQAGAMGLPCIVTNISGSNEIIKDEVNGLIVPIENAYAISYAMNELINDEVLVSRMKEKARNNIVAKYTQEIVWEAILSEYKKATNKL